MNRQKCLVNAMIKEYFNLQMRNKVKGGFEL